MPAILRVGLPLTFATGGHGVVAWDSGLDEEDDDIAGFAGHGSDSTRPKVEAFFTSESYPRGGNAHLVIADQPARSPCGSSTPAPRAAWTTANDQMFGLLSRRPGRSAA